MNIMQYDDGKPTLVTMVISDYYMYYVYDVGKCDMILKK